MYCTYQAQERARALLLEYLSPEQRVAFQAAGHFDIVKTGSRRSLGMILLGYPRFRVYRLSRSGYPVTLFTSARQLARSVPKYGYCIHSRGAAPRDDELLSMKLLIEHDEPQFVSIGFRFTSPETRARLFPAGQREFREDATREAVALLDSTAVDDTARVT